MHRVLILMLVVWSSGCGDRPAPGLAGDGGVTPLPGASLKLRYKTTLETADRDGLDPSVASDGKRFGVAWVAVSRKTASDGYQHIAFLQPDSAPSLPIWYRAWTNQPVVPPSVIAEPGGRWSVLIGGEAYGTPKLDLGSYSSDGKTISPLFLVSGQTMARAQAAPPGGGHAVIYTQPSKVASLMFIWKKSERELKQATIASGDLYNDLWLDVRSGGGYLAGWGGDKAYYLAHLGGDGKLVGTPAAVAERSGPWAARFALAGERVGLAYLHRSTGSASVELLFKVLDLQGKTIRGPRRVASDVAVMDTPLALAWSGKRFAVVYDAKRPDHKLSARLLAADGTPESDPVTVAGCLATARKPAAAWAGDTLAVVYQAGKSGLPDSEICAAVFTVE